MGFTVGGTAQFLGIKFVKKVEEKKLAEKMRRGI